MADWSADQYLKFEDERTRPSRDLLAQVPLSAPRKAVDIGCGPGNSTELLVQRWPQAEIIGIDTSADMLRQARERLPAQTFIETNVAHWVPPANTDVLFANAIFQWVPEHLRHLQRLLGTLPSGGVLAIQMPDNLDEPSHVMMREVAHAGPWRQRWETPPAFAICCRTRAPIRRAAAAERASRDLAHHLQSRARRCGGHCRMGQGYGAAAVRRPLEPAERKEFLREYTARVAAAYLPQADGKVLLRFPRLFVVAVRN